MRTPYLRVAVQRRVAASALRKVSVYIPITLRSSLSGTFLQTLPQLVTYATEGTLFMSAQLSNDAVSAFLKVSGINKTVEAT